MFRYLNNNVIPSGSAVCAGRSLLFLLYQPQSSSTEQHFTFQATQLSLMIFPYFKSGAHLSHHKSTNSCINSEYRHKTCGKQTVVLSPAQSSCVQLFQAMTKGACLPRNIAQARGLSKSSPSRTLLHAHKKSYAQAGLSWTMCYLPQVLCLYSVC